AGVGEGGAEGGRPEGRGGGGVGAAVQAGRSGPAAVRARALPPPARLADLVRGDVRSARRRMDRALSVEAARRRSLDPRAARGRSLPRGAAAPGPPPAL